MNNENLDALGIKEIQLLAKQMQIHPSYKVGGLRVRKNKAELLRDIRKRNNGTLEQ